MILIRWSLISIIRQERLRFKWHIYRHRQSFFRVLRLRIRVRLMRKQPIKLIPKQRRFRFILSWWVIRGGFLLILLRRRKLFQRGFRFFHQQQLQLLLLQLLHHQLIRGMIWFRFMRRRWSTSWVFLPWIWRQSWRVRGVRMIVRQQRNQQHLISRGWQFQDILSSFWLI
jgi:hypothetical protein